MDGRKSAAPRAPAGENARLADADAMQLDLLGGPAVPAALTPVYAPACPPPATA
ncbi:hypothetical protein [Sphingomonas solaris]|uniref:hypothetical protein n=1 Tax=Alterirhizorhabdus solaris TaxID=2529389 RepID=UPI0013969484|nr:hypothetical protein [Sphingomonas solaris]